MAGLTWIHLSDWHQGASEFDRKVVLDALKNDIKSRTGINQDLAIIDFIVFSGDLAFGGETMEYETAKKEFFQPLLEAANITPDKLFIVPGNHDLNRDDFELLPPALLKPLNSDSDVNRWLDDERKRKNLLQPFDAFSKFVASYTQQKDANYSFIRDIDIDGKKIALLGINSAWMCGRHKNAEGKIDDEKYVIVGEPQIQDHLTKISDAYIKIVVLHHPFEWMSDFDRRHIEERLTDNCDFILNGHQHKPDAKQISKNKRFFVHISTGASFVDRISRDPLFINAYNLVHLDLAEKKGVVFLRRWSDRQTKWIDDRDTLSDGRLDFSLIKEMADTKSQPSKINDDAQNSTIALEIIPRQIPSPPADFKGREEEIADILNNFEKGATITGLRGMGGIGKTALAIVLANKLSNRFPDGQLFVNAMGTSPKPLTPEEIMAHVIRSYHPTIKLPDDHNGLEGLYRSVLAGKRVLLLLDNASNREQVESLLPPSGCAVLITSRNRFALSGLKEKDLDLLPLPDARKLLLEIDSRIGKHAEELAELCGRLPLAMRNAAYALAEQKNLSVSDYLQRLKDSRKLLEMVEASFSLSYELLSQIRRKQWRLLSIFPKDFDCNGAAAVWKMGRDPSEEAISELAKWSLVEFIHPVDSEGGYYRLHDLARLFAKSRLEKNELAEAKKSHAKHYSKVLSRANKLYDLGGKSILEGLELFDHEWININAGQNWTYEVIRNARKSKKEEGFKLALQLAISYPNDGRYLLDLRLHPQDKIHWLETALNAAKLTKNLDAQGTHLGNLGASYHNIGKFHKAIECFDQGLAIKRKLRDHKGELGGLSNLGGAYNALGEMHKTIEYYEQALNIARKIGDQKGEGVVLGNLGGTYIALGEMRKAIDYCDQALAIAKEIGDRRSEGVWLGNLGGAYNELGETRKAIDYCDQALAIAKEIGDRKGEGSRLDNLGLAYVALGETRKAIEYHEQSLAIAREIEDKRNEGEELCNLGKANLYLNETDKAIEYCTESLSIVRKIEYRKCEGETLSTLGKAYSNLGEIDKSIDHCDQALKIFKEMEYRRGEGEALFTKSLAMHKLDRRTEAVALANEALQIFSQIESPLKAEKVRQKLAEWAVGN